jgi:capsular exopolysaccharide synthesis family protein
MQFSDFLHILWRRRVVVVLVVVFCTAAAAVYAYKQPKRYESTATLAFTPNPKKGQLFIPTESLSALLSTYAEIAKSTQNRQAAEVLLGHRVTGALGTSTGAGSAILQVSDVNTNPREAAETANAITQALAQRIESGGLLLANLVNPPVTPSTPLQPRPPLIISVALVLGLMIGVLFALALDRFRNAADDPVQLTETTGLPVLGTVPRERSLTRGGSQLVWSSHKLEPLQEAFRALRTNVELLIDELPSVIQVTSANPQDGKSTIVANLAIALGQIGIQTTIVDADLRRPQQHEIFGLDNRVGLSSALMLPGGGISPQETDYGGVSVLTSGPIPHNAPEMLHVRFPSILRTLREQGGMVLVDSTPVNPVSDARLIARHADAVLFVVAVDRTQLSTVSSAIEKLRFAQANLIGLVLNRGGRDPESAGGYSYRAPELQPTRARSSGSVPAA